MRLSRRYQVLPAYAYCTVCDWKDQGTGRKDLVHIEAASHTADDGGHDTRAVTTQETIYTTARLEAVASG